MTFSKSTKLIQSLIKQERLPDSFESVVVGVYRPIIDKLIEQIEDQTRPTIIAINGCPGSGKSTMALFLKELIDDQFNKHGVSISIDDFYKTKKERTELATQIHSLLLTRGVPGTHDIDLALSTLQNLKDASSDKPCRIPRFDKACDDRHPPDQWQEITKPVDYIIFEGWCVAATAQSNTELENPINSLEKEFDTDGSYRHFVNSQLIEHYPALFTQLDYLIVLHAPTPDIVVSWRIEQEKKLRDAVSASKANQDQSKIGMSDDEIKKFVMHYERLIRHMHNTLPSKANALIQLKRDRSVTDLRFF